MSRFRLEAAIDGNLEKFMVAELKAATNAVERAISDATDGLKRELRGQVEAAGLGSRLARTIRSETYPKSGKSLDPVGLVYTKAPKLLSVFETGATITPVNGSKYLAIPTENVPHKTGGRGLRRMSPVEVEASFDQQLKFAKAGNGRLLAYLDVVHAKNKRGWRKGTRRRISSGRSLQTIPMFVLIPQAHLRKRIDIQGAGERWADRIPSLIDKHWQNPA